MTVYLTKLTKLNEIIWSIDVIWEGNGSSKKIETTWHVYVDKCDYGFIANECQRKVSRTNKS